MKHQGEFNQLYVTVINDAHNRFLFLCRFNYKTELLKNLTAGDAMVINVFNHTVMQGEEGVTATVDLPSIDGELLVSIPSSFTWKLVCFPTERLKLEIANEELVVMFCFSYNNPSYFKSFFQGIKAVLSL